MLSTETADEILEQYAKLKTHETPSNVISTAFPDALVLCKKRYQTAYPELGLAHSCNDVFLPLMKFCSIHRDYNSRILPPKIALTQSLQNALARVTFRAGTPDQRRAQTKVAAYMELYKDPEFAQIENFIYDFQRWVRGDFDDPSKRKPIYLEPFQKNLLTHVVFFISVTKLPTLANRVTEYLTHVLNIHYASQGSLELFKQKATVFLVPRRHGKTWFMVPIICFLLKNIIGISIGYVAHQKHVSQFVLKEVEFRCKRMFGRTHTVENKDNVISVDHVTAKSTALFASCYNTNVSIQNAVITSSHAQCLSRVAQHYLLDHGA